jgi:type III secretion system FlhB-like substrate exporter
MHKAIKNYEQHQSKFSVLKEQRALNIIAQAKIYGVSVFENDVLASELLELNLKDEFDKETFGKFLEVIKKCEDAISKAQMSS